MATSVNRISAASLSYEEKMKSTAKCGTSASTDHLASQNPGSTLQIPLSALALAASLDRSIVKERQLCTMANNLAGAADTLANKRMQNDPRSSESGQDTEVDMMSKWPIELEAANTDLDCFFGQTDSSQDLVGKESLELSMPKDLKGLPADLVATSKSELEMTQMQEENAKLRQQLERTPC